MREIALQVPDPRRRVVEGVILFAGSLYGFAAAVTLLPQLRGPAPADQPAGYMKHIGMDAHVPTREVLLLIFLPIVAAILARPLARLLGRIETRTWSAVTAIASLTTALLLATMSYEWFVALLVPLSGIGIAILLRRFDARFNRSDVLLVPVLMSFYFAFIAFYPKLGATLDLVIAAGLVLLLRLGVAAIAGGNRIAPAYAFLFAPLSLIFQVRPSGISNEFSGLMAILFVPLVSVSSALFLSPRWLTPRRFSFIAGFIVYPLVALIYPQTFTVFGAERIPRVQFFEDGHDLLPASEMMRGERPYRDIIPGHGLIEDGLWDYLVMKSGAESLGTILKLRAIPSMITPVVMYAIGFAATGVPELGFLGLFFTICMLPMGPLFDRIMPSIASLAFVAAAVRRRASRYLIGAGVLAVLAVMNSIEFGAYALFVLGIASLRFGRDYASKLRAIGRAALGCAIGFAPFALVFLVLGILIDFFRVTLFEVLTLTPAYAIGPIALPPHIVANHTFPELVTLFFTPDPAMSAWWPLIVMITAAGLAVSPLANSRRTGPLWMIGLFIAIASLSYAERKHTYYAFVVPLFLLVGVATIARLRIPYRRALLAVAIPAMVVLARPNSHLSITAYVRAQDGFFDRNVRMTTLLPRAKNALFWENDVRKIEILKYTFQRTLGPRDTFFDFSNTPLLYFLFDRNCPIREYEVPFYESRDKQLDVVRRLQSDPRVRLAIMEFRADYTGSIDGIMNSERAPLVWRWLQQNFEPAVAQEGVVVWKRKGLNLPTLAVPPQPYGPHPE